VYRWIQTLGRAIRSEETRGPLAAAGLLLLTGTIFYCLVEHWTFVDSLYFCVTTLTTVGFGNPAPTTDLGKLFTVFFVLSGVGMFLAVINALGKQAIKEARPRLRHRATKEELEVDTSRATAAVEFIKDQEDED
jgi:hypothetical protein